MIIFLNLILILFIPFFLVEIFFEKTNKINSIYIATGNFFQKILNKISNNWSEAAGIDETNENGSEQFSNFLIFFGIISAFYSFIPYFISLNSDFTFILTFSLIIILLSLFLYIPMTFNKFTIEVVEKKTPFILLPILLIIELISYTFKIMSLTIRISVNSSTGHALALIFFTLSNYLLEITLNSFGKFMGIIFYIICIVYMLMEIFISLLQIYVFNLLAYYYEYENF